MSHDSHNSTPRDNNHFLKGKRPELIELIAATPNSVSKPFLIVVQIDVQSTTDAAACVLAWMRRHAIKTLNVAGPPESKRPEIYRLIRDLLHAIEATLHSAG